MVWKVAQRLSHSERARWKGEGAPPAVCEAVLDSEYRTGYENATPCPERTGGTVPRGDGRIQGICFLRATGATALGLRYEVMPGTPGTEGRDGRNHPARG